MFICLEITSVRGELCEKASKTWSGNCGNTGHCDNQCKSWEGAAHGACHVRGGKHMCFCYFTCSKAQKLAHDKLNAKELAQEKLNAKKLENDAFIHNVTMLLFVVTKVYCYNTITSNN